MKFETAEEIEKARLNEIERFLYATKKGAGRPTTGYRLADGTKVPSVTTITGRFSDKQGIIAKAKMLWHEAGARGEPFHRDKFWGGAMEIGTLVHLSIEAQLHGTPPPEIAHEYEVRVQSALLAWRNWLSETRLEIIATELPLVSEMHKYGGTLDAVARDSQGRLALLDWKSSKGIFEDYLWQLAAYGELWNETQDERLTGGFRIVRIAKTYGDLEFRHYPELDDALETFLLLRSAFETTKSVKQRAA